jgi:hypothetical protein
VICGSAVLTRVRGRIWPRRDCTCLNDRDQFGTEGFPFSETEAALYFDLGVPPTARPMPTGQDGTPLDPVIVAS